jgi:hypothetical protein
MGRLRRPQARWGSSQCRRSRFQCQRCPAHQCVFCSRGERGRDVLRATGHACDMVNVVCDGLDVRSVRVRRHEYGIKVDLQPDVSRAARCGGRLRTITMPSRCPTPVPTCRSTSSGTFRGISRSARAEEWLHITGARDILSAASAVSSDVCERSTRTPRRLSSLTKVSPNGLCGRGASCSTV